MKKNKLLLLAMISLVSISGKAQNWNEIIKNVASDRGDGDIFGYSVSISGNKAVVGAYQEDEDVTGGNTLDNSGSAYIFELNGGVWTETAKLVASDRADNDVFGYSVTISGDKVVVSAPSDDHDATGGNYLSSSGSVYVFELSGGVWSQTAKLVASDRGAQDSFGRAICISGDRIIIGSSLDDEDALDGNTLSNSGSAYIFEYDAGVWAQTAKIVASDRSVSDLFGYSVSLDGTRAVIGAVYENDDASGGNTLSHAGSAYIFELSGGVWTQTAKIVASDRGADDEFGWSIGISGDKVIVGAHQEDEDALDGNTLLNSGSAYVFEFSGGAWVETAKLVASDRGQNDEFGCSVSISGEKAVIGAHHEDDNVAGGDALNNSGSAYAFELVGSEWIQTDKLISSDRADNDYFGTSVSISGDKIIVGAKWEDEDVSGLNTLSAAGSVYVFNYSQTTSINEESVGLISIYPNPVNSQLFINSKENIESIEIRNALGQIVKTITSSTNLIDVSDLTKGIYFLQIEASSGLVSKRFIKE